MPSRRKNRSKSRRRSDSKYRGDALEERVEKLERQMNKLAHTFTVSDMRNDMGGSLRDDALQEFLNTFDGGKRLYTSNEEPNAYRTTRV